MNTNVGAFAQFGAKYLEQGYRPIPILPGHKCPGFNRVRMTQWQAKWSAELPITEEEFEKWCASDAGIAILLGQISGDAVGIDIDTTDPKIHTAILKQFRPRPYAPPPLAARVSYCQAILRHDQRIALDGAPAEPVGADARSHQDSRHES